MRLLLPKITGSDTFMTKAHFVNHTHWDREWYFTTEDAQVLSDQLFSNVLKELETHPEANFYFRRTDINTR